MANIGPGANSAVPSLLKAIQQGGDKESNFASIAYCLGKIGPGAAAAEPALLGLLKGPDRNAAVLSAWALGQIRPNSAEIAGKTVPVLVEGLAMPVEQCRLLAAEALGGLGPLAKDSATALQKATTDADQDVREAAAKATIAVQGAVAPQSAREPEAIKPGDSVITVEDSVVMKSGSAVVARVAKGTELRVLEVRTPWVAVQTTIDGKPTTGWVLQPQVKKP